MDYTSILSSLFGGGFVLPYVLGDKFTTSWGQWEHYRGTRADDQKRASVFKLKAPKGSLVLEAARNGVKKLRVWAGETEEAGEAVIYLATEPVTPLPLVLEELALEGTHKDQFLAMGLRQASQGVAFLNNQCKLIHGNICMATIVVTAELDWKLAFLDMTSEHAHLTSSLLARCGKLVADYYKSAELARGDMEALAEGPPWAVDAWGLGCLMQEVFSGKALSAPQELQNVSTVPKEVLAEYQKLLGQNPVRRLNPNKLSDAEFLKNDLVDVVTFLETLSIREPLEKDKFFRRLPKAIPLFPKSICTRKLLPLIAGALEYGGAPAMALGCLLQIGKMLDGEEEFKQRIIPIISALFSSTDHSIRRSLINNINEYAPFLTEHAVETSIYPQLSRGLQEPNAYLREQTLKAMLPLAPKLSQRTLNGVLLKQLAKLQVDEEPSIRANTTVLLGNIAGHLGPVACKRILLNAFTRALRDVFPPSRVAALKALMATSCYHLPSDVAARVLPAVSPMMLDANADVRAAACKAMDFFVKMLRQASSDLDKGIEPTSTSTQEAKDLSGNVSSFLGWAITSISGATSSLATPNATPNRAAPAGAPQRATNGAAPAVTNGVAGKPRAQRALDFGGATNGSAAAAADASSPLSPVVDTSSLDQLGANAADGWGVDVDAAWDEPLPAEKPPLRPKPKVKLGTRKGGGKGD